MSNAVIEVDGVWKKFRKGELHDSLRELIPDLARRLVGKGPKAGELEREEFWALRDVSFEVKRGESLGIIGPNGAGKSTMLKLLSRIMKPNLGQIRVHGRLSALIEVGAGFHQDLTGRENIYLNGTILGMKKAEIRAKEEAIIDFAGVEEFIETPVKRYSSGMKARLGFAVAAHLDPDVLLVDEVLSVGDAKFRQKCIFHMKALLRSGITVVFISHILDQVRSLCPNTIVLDKGGVVYQGVTDGAIRVYLDALGNGGEGHESADAAACLRDIRFLNEDGAEVIEASSGGPLVIEAELVVRTAMDRLVVLINFQTLSGVYLGTASSMDAGIPESYTAGVHRVRFRMDRMPLGDGDYNLEFKVCDRATVQCIWDLRQPRPLSVRTSGGVNAPVVFEGVWEASTVREAARSPRGEESARGVEQGA